ncbi:MAG: triacylglycerol lipase [Oscillospiraceae bacterium]|nr:triacylglycerol lipase [Oscillospiraceae bacterium]
MQYLKRLCFYPLVLLFLNAILLFEVSARLGALWRILALALLSAAFLYYNIRPAADKASPGRQRILIGGYELIVAAGFFLAFQIAFHIYFYLIAQRSSSTEALIGNVVFGAVWIAALLLNGMIRVTATSKQLGAVPRVLMFFLWWVPFANAVVLGMACKTVKAEYKFLRAKRLLDESRKGKEICKTAYPILMVHGVFFRDWKYFNYWGRIPKELAGNGAQIYYGNHNSALPVEAAAAELKQRILEVLRETGSEKVNIIAHSKGGMDARYAISCLGMDARVASLTTVSTPHRGTPLAGKLLALTPEKAVSAIGRQYGKLFARLGDDNCDFLGSVNGLTVEACDELNKAMPDREGVLYQSVGSKMSAASSAGPPLNAGYAILKPLGGDNDGLVCTDSMAWGNFLGILSTASKRGISHGDMIDLTRKDIPGFDVCEFYVRLAAELKDKGL